MNDLISRQAAVKALQDKVFHNLSDEFYGTMQVLDELPPVDAEPIVRCKDCEWWTKQKSSIQGRCAKLEIYPTGAWFCANGEKRGADNA